jgi:hypothetical protein
VHISLARFTNARNKLKETAEQKADQMRAAMGGPVKEKGYGQYAQAAALDGPGAGPSSSASSAKAGSTFGEKVKLADMAWIWSRIQVGSPNKGSVELPIPEGGGGTFTAYNPVSAGGRQRGKSARSLLNRMGKRDDERNLVVGVHAFSVSDYEEMCLRVLRLSACSCRNMTRRRIPFCRFSMSQWSMQGSSGLVNTSSLVSSRFTEK